MEINNVAVAGASGILGTHLLTHLSSSSLPPSTPKFTLYALHRPTSPYTPPHPSIHPLPTLYTSPSSLTHTLTSSKIDVFINCLPPSTTSLPQQKLIIDACEQAGVKLYVANEWVADLENAVFKRMPVEIVGEKGKGREYLVQRLGSAKTAGEGEDKEEGKKKMKWVSINAGPFWDLWLPRFFNPSTHRATIYGRGTNPTIWTPLCTLSSALTYLLLHFPSNPSHKQLWNRVHYLRGIRGITGMNCILAAFEAETGGRKWDVERIDLTGIREVVEREERKGEEGRDEKALVRGLTLLAQFGEEEGVADFGGKVMDGDGGLGVVGVSVEEAVREWVRGLEEKEKRKGKEEKEEKNVMGKIMEG
ncbi:MAG: hypothetical protein Q9227_002277 [Pyrenula ochraceoflavens]